MMRRARVRNACQPGWVSTPASVMGLVSMTSAAGRDIFLSIEETPRSRSDRTYGTVTYAPVATSDCPGGLEQLEQERQLLDRVPGQVVILCVTNGQLGILVAEIGRIDNRDRGFDLHFCGGVIDE